MGSVIHRYGLLAFLVLVPPALAQDKGHCPDNPTGSHRFFDGQSVEQDKARLVALAPEAKARKQVCILTFAEADNGGYSKKLAIRRAVWMVDTLVAQGVPRDIIAVEIRPAAGGDPGAVRHAEVIFGGR